MKQITLISILCATITFSTIAQTFSGGGTGTETDPFVILTTEDLLLMHDVIYVPDAYTYYRMEADIDLNGVEWTALNLIGPYEKPLYFDGNGHVIKNLDTGGYNYASLFGVLRGVCKNLGVINARVGNASSKFDGTNSVNIAGIIAGYLANNNYNTPNGQGVIENCYTTGIVSANQVAGGIVGTMGRPASGSGYPLSYIRNCYSKATVTAVNISGNSRAGGVIGVVPAPAGVTPHPVEVEYCFSTGTVTSGSSTDRNGPGGIVGYSDLPMHGLVSLNTNIVRPDASHDQYGRIAAVTTNNSYDEYENWALESVDITKNNIQKPTFNETLPITNYNSYDGISKTAKFLANIENWANLGYDLNIWKMGENGHPIFKWQTIEYDNEVPEGTQGNPIKIYTADDLNNVRNKMNDYYILMNDIDVSINYPLWTPIGKTTEGTDSYTPFNGNFDGDGHTISGVNINYTGYYIGFFAVLGGTIKNLGIEGDVLNNDGATTGLLVGYLGQDNFPSIIENCYAKGTVTSVETTSKNDSHAGLLVGNQTRAYSIIRNCHVKGSVFANKNFVGGIAGRQNHQHSTISNCYSEADVTGGGNYVGGIVGRIYGSNANNCYATGTIKGISYVGGIAGDRYNNQPSSGLVAANDSVLATTSYLGRVVGNIGSGASVSNTYGWEGTVLELDGVTQNITSSTTDKDGESKTLADLHDQTLYTNMGWDFDDQWAMCSSTGFPIFKRDLKYCISTSVSNHQQKSSHHNLSYANGSLSIMGLKWNNMVCIYTISGNLIQSAKATGVLQVKLPQPGFYIIDIKNENNHERIKFVAK